MRGAGGKAEMTPFRSAHFWRSVGGKQLRSVKLIKTQSRTRGNWVGGFEMLLGSCYFSPFFLLLLVLEYAIGKVILKIEWAWDKRAARLADIGNRSVRLLTLIYFEKNLLTRFSIMGFKTNELFWRLLQRGRRAQCVTFDKPTNFHEITWLPLPRN